MGQGNAIYTAERLPIFTGRETPDQKIQLHHDYLVRLEMRLNYIATQVATEKYVDDAIAKAINSELRNQN